MNNLPHTTTLVLGDWSDDGHGKTDIVMLASNLDSEEIAEAYEKASKKLGFNFINDVAADYEDNELPTDYLKKLVEYGLSLKQVFEYEYDIERAEKALENEDSEGVPLWPDSYTQIFLFIVKLGNPEFEFKILEDDTDRIDIGGYGLFQ